MKKYQVHKLETMRYQVSVSDMLFEAGDYLDAVFLAKDLNSRSCYTADVAIWVCASDVAHEYADDYELLARLENGNLTYYTLPVFEPGCNVSEAVRDLINKHAAMSIVRENLNKQEASFVLETFDR